MCTGRCSVSRWSAEINLVPYVGFHHNWQICCTITLQRKYEKCWWKLKRTLRIYSKLATTVLAACDLLCRPNINILYCKWSRVTVSLKSSQHAATLSVCTLCTLLNSIFRPWKLLTGGRRSARNLCSYLFEQVLNITSCAIIGFAIRNPQPTPAPLYA